MYYIIYIIVLNLLKLPKITDSDSIITIHPQIWEFYPQYKRIFNEAEDAELTNYWQLIDNFSHLKAP